MRQYRPHTPPTVLNSSSAFLSRRCLWVALLVAALTSGCGTTQSALPSIAPDAPLRYSAYCDALGHVRGERSALALMGHPAHRERVYRQAQEGLYPASEVWLDLEAVCLGAGRWTAEEQAGWKCTVLPSELGCEFNWNPVKALIPGEGAGRDRLLEMYRRGYDARWKELQGGQHVRTEIARAGMLMAGVALGRGPAAAESRATVEESRALGVEARASAVEAGAEGARVGALLSAETLGLSRALNAEEASALEARLLELEAESPGKREAFSGEELREGRLKAQARPAELTAEDTLWDEFEAYRQRRFREVLEQWRGGKRPLSVKPPLRWEAYEEFREHFQRSHEFETKVGGVLARESEESAGSRGMLKESRQPLIARHVGTTKSGQAGVRYPDYLVVDETTLTEGSAPRVDSISVKQRNFMNKSRAEVVHQVEIDAQEVVNKYGGRLEVRRLGHPLYGRTIQISKLHLIYDIRGVGGWKSLIQSVCKNYGVEVHFE